MKGESEKKIDREDIFSDMNMMIKRSLPYNFKSIPIKKISQIRLHSDELSFCPRHSHNYIASCKKNTEHLLLCIPLSEFRAPTDPTAATKVNPHFPRTHSCVIMKSVHVPYSAHVPCEITVQRHRKMHVKTSYANTALYANTNTTQRSAERMHVGVRDDLIVLMRRSAPIETIVDPIASLDRSAGAKVTMHSFYQWQWKIYLINTNGMIVRFTACTVSIHQDFYRFIITKL